MSDCKAVMADGEMWDSGAEIATEIDLTGSIIEDPGFNLSRPVIGTDDTWKVLASAGTLEEVSQIANQDATVVLEHGLDRTDTHLFSNFIVDLKIR